MVDGVLIGGAGRSCTVRSVDPTALGLRLRALRIAQGLRQSDLASRSRVSRRVIGEVERGLVARASLDDVARISIALRASLDVRVRWNGEQLDRLMDAAHAATVAALLDRLAKHGWECLVEASFSIWGERGSIDVLGWHASTSTLLVVEVKSVVPDLQALLAKLDRNTRLAPEIARERGWRPIRVGRLLVVADSPTSRGRIRQSATILLTALPDHGSTVRQWLAAPSGQLRGLLLLSNAQHSHTGKPVWRRERVRAARTRVSHTTGAMDKARQAGSGGRG
jgi:transcriptional regulator with XRE-family HTH domain